MLTYDQTSSWDYLVRALNHSLPCLKNLSSIEKLMGKKFTLEGDKSFLFNHVITLNFANVTAGFFITVITR